MNKKKAKALILDLVFLLVLIAADQYTKYIAVLKLKNQPAFNIINGVLEFNYLENRGAAFGMLQNQKIFFEIDLQALGNPKPFGPRWKGGIFLTE